MSRRRTRKKVRSRALMYAGDASRPRGAHASRTRKKVRSRALMYAGDASRPLKTQKRYHASMCMESVATYGVDHKIGRVRLPERERDTRVVLRTRQPVALGAAESGVTDVCTLRTYQSVADGGSPNDSPARSLVGCAKRDCYERLLVISLCGARASARKQRGSMVKTIK